jgi:hypothetical protein
MSKIHLSDFIADYRGRGQSGYDYEHQTACGYVRSEVTRYAALVDCKLCIREIKAKSCATST